MRATIEDFKTGWFGIGLGIKQVEIDSLIQHLQALKKDPSQHFHRASDFAGSGGVGDIEIYIEPDLAPDDLKITGFAILPNKE